jgi:7,8-dihydropterin-6-yl-methyl-4-(beta-D-ribofuranosyl)aminobenzene 5'-phosphate synthase
MRDNVRISIIYDNTSQREDLTADWGFACLIEAHGHRILFDTGASGELLMTNMELLGIGPSSIDGVFISHDHWDHTGGLSVILAANPTIRVWVPSGCKSVRPSKQVTVIDGPQSLSAGLHTPGPLGGIEQSLVMPTDAGVVVVVGCSHPGVGQILEAASTNGRPYALIGGLHGFDDYPRLAGLNLICPTHCTQHIDEIKSHYPEVYVPGGAGAVIEV